MSAAQARIIETQQATIRKQAKVIETFRRAVDNAVPVLRAGDQATALKDLLKVYGGAK